MRTFSSLGPVEIVTKSKLILVKLDSSRNIPEIGSIVTDANGNYIGKIMDIIGPIDRAYAVIKPRSYAMLSSIKTSTVLFYRPRIQQKYRTSRGKRK
ncbi:MAG: hypothetical protein QXG46_01565 [Ignisphaera sp.]